MGKIPTISDATILVIESLNDNMLVRLGNSEYLDQTASVSALVVYVIISDNKCSNILENSLQTG